MDPLRGITVGSYGQTFQLTCVDRDGAAQDVSGYTTITIVARSPDDQNAITCDASYVTDGQDGKVIGMWADGDIDREGRWKLQIVFEKTGAVAKSYITYMEVGASLAA